MQDYQKFMDKLKNLEIDESLLEKVTPENFTYVQELYERFKQEEPNPSIAVQQASFLEAITTYTRLKAEEQASGYIEKEPVNTDDKPTRKLSKEALERRLKELRQQDSSKTKTRILRMFPEDNCGN